MKKSIVVFICCLLSGLGFAKSVYITDMSKCKPAAFSEKLEQGKWQLIDYSTAELRGKMIGTLAHINAPAVTVPVQVNGWHKIYVGYWNPKFDSNWGTPTTLQIKLSDQKGFRLIHDSASNGTQDATFLREVYFDCADLTGKDIVLDKSNGLLGHRVYYAYIKLVPMSDKEIESVIADREDDSTRNLTSTIDGMSYFFWNQFEDEEDILSLVEPYRYSDVGKVLWAVNYGDRVNYPTKVAGAIFVDKWASYDFEDGVIPTKRNRGETQMKNTLLNFASKGIIAQNIAAKHCHEMGIKFDIMMRLGILGKIPASQSHGGFLDQNPDCRQMLADGTVLEKASFAFPKTQDFMLGLIRESASQIDCDGVNLCFVRGPHALWYEKPILRRFKEKYGEDARKVDPSDKRLHSIRAEIMTEFMQKVRKCLDEVGCAKGKKIELSIWVWPSWRKVWLGSTPYEEGLDVKAWIEAGLLDEVICQQGIDKDYIAAGKANDCEFTLFPDYRGVDVMGPASIVKFHDQGIEKFAYWDMDCAQIRANAWEWIKMSGHYDFLKSWDSSQHNAGSFRLMTVDGIDVEKGLATAVYSGG
ncbi:MAG: hypothetical protein ACIAQZ_01325 [Sedimentisphaeraceae bacterium JB056]